jgi:hypothetical protein
MPGKLFLLVGRAYMEHEEELVLLRRRSFQDDAPNLIKMILSRSFCQCFMPHVASL